MTETNFPHPKIVSRDEWLAARKQLLAKEKDHTRHLDAINAERRRLPMVRLDKDYAFERAGGQARQNPLRPAGGTSRTRRPGGPRSQPTGENSARKRNRLRAQIGKRNGS